MIHVRAAAVKNISSATVGDKHASMTATQRFYVKLFLNMGVPYALFMTLFDLFEGLDLSVWKFLFLFVFFGGTMSLTLGSMHISRLRKKGMTTIRAKDLNVVQRFNLHTILSINHIHDILLSDAQFGNMKMSILPDELQLRSKTSWFSWGEKIKIELLQNSDNQFEYAIQSRPIIWGTLVDGGKNFENVRRLEELLVR